MSSFSNKIYGKRSAENRKKKKELEKEKEQEKLEVQQNKGSLLHLKFI
jgi:hypothetical protein